MQPIPPSGNEEKITPREKSCVNPTTIKVAGFVTGLILVGVGLGLYFFHVNTIAACVVGGIGTSLAIGMFLDLIISRCRPVKDKAEIERIKAEIERIKGMISRRENPEATIALQNCTPSEEDRSELLSMAVMSGNRSMVKFLLVEGAEQPKDSTKTLLIWTLLCAKVNESERLEMARPLLDKFPDLARKQDPLHFIAKNQTETKVPLVELLISRGADPNAKDSEGNTPLHCVARQKEVQKQIIDALIKGGGDPSIKDAEGKTFLDIMKKQNFYWWFNHESDFKQAPDL